MTRALEQATLLDLPHHDGSDLYVPDRPDAPGGEATLVVDVPDAAGFERVLLRTVVDGEPRVVPAERDGGSRWRATLPMRASTMHYRWLLDGDGGYAWLNATGVSAREVSDADDFVLSVDPGAPDWHRRSVVYEIFPDRFATSGLEVEPPDWAVARAWDERPNGRHASTPHEWFGGDLRGIERRLEHVEALGANVIYLTPFFPAGSTHRYDASSFDRVDPLLGGDEALRALLDAAHARGIRVLGDLTTNHVGRGHDWFRAAQADPDAVERGFFYFDERERHGYAAWMGVPSLPKLNWASEELRRRMTAVVRRWLDEGLDGWRIDVANMTARHGDYDANAEVARLIRSVVPADKLLLAEHGHDFRADVGRGGWHGTMNYAGFLRPVWSWLRGAELPDELTKGFWALPVELAHADGLQAAATMRDFRSGLPWQAVLDSWVLLDSHDVARFRTVAGSRERQLVGVGLQMTLPGVPMLFAGDELGLTGAWGEDARTTMPWHDPSSWDGAVLAAYRELIALRRSSDALARGSLRLVHVAADVLAYLRESPDERLLCLAARAPHDPISVPFRGLETLAGADAHDGVLPSDGPSFHVWRIPNG